MATRILARQLVSRILPVSVAASAAAIAFQGARPLLTWALTSLLLLFNAHLTAMALREDAWTARGDIVPWVRTLSFALGMPVLLIAAGPVPAGWIVAIGPMLLLPWEFRDRRLALLAALIPVPALCTVGLLGAQPPWIGLTTLLILGLTAMPSLAMARTHLDLLHRQLQDVDHLNQALRDASATAVSERARTAHAMRFRSAFLANMGHEIRTPMTSLLGLTDLMVAQSSQTKRQIVARQARQTGQELLQLVQDLLDLSKLESGEVSLKNEPLDIVALTNDAARVTRVGQGLPVPIVVHNHVGDDRWRRGDALRIRQILLKLMGNAVKFTRSNAIVAVFIDEEATSGHVQISVRDRGIGLSPAQIDAMFEPFAQVDDSPTRTVNGLGLGLALSRSLAEAQSGRLDVVSRLGAGSTFTLTLPLMPCPRPTTETAAKADLRGMHILIAEDNQVNQMIIAHMLTDQGARVTVVENGVEAVEAVFRYLPDAVVMDVQMPVMSGTDATLTIRSDPMRVGWNVPIIALTANVQREQRDEVFAAGMNGFLGKPVTAEELAFVIAQNVTRARQHTPAHHRGKQDQAQRDQAREPDRSIT